MRRRRSRRKGGRRREGLGCEDKEEEKGVWEGEGRGESKEEKGGRKEISERKRERDGQE